MRHANNAVYVDWLEESLIDEGLRNVVEAIPRTYRLRFFSLNYLPQILIIKVRLDDLRPGAIVALVELLD